jgi:hypothetical protein
MYDPRLRKLVVVGAALLLLLGGYSLTHEQLYRDWQALIHDF